MSGKSTRRGRRGPRRAAASPRAAGGGTEQVRHERDLLAAVLDHAGALVTVLDRQGRIVRFNRACEQLTGYRPEEVIGRPIWDLFLLPEEAEAVRAVMADLIARAGPNRHENYWRTREGALRLIDWTNTVLLDESGAVEHLVGVGIDVTERREAERALRESQTRYRAVMDQAGDAVFICDNDLRFEDVNARCWEMLGYTREELLRLGVLDVTDPEDVARNPITMPALRVGQSAIRERILRRRDGTRIPVEINVRRIADGRLVAIARDIAERRQAEAALRESEARFRSVLESNLIGILVWDAQGNVRDANDAFLGMLGYTREDARSGRLSWRDITPPEYAAQDDRALEQIRRTGSCPPFEKEYVRRDGSRVPVLLGAIALEEHDDRGVCFVLDLTEKKRIEALLAQSERYLERAQELAHIGGWEADLVTWTAVFSDQMCEIYGLRPNPGHISWDDFLARIHPEDRGLIEGHVRGTIEKPAPFGYEHRLVRPDGSVRIVEVTGEPVLDAEGRVARLLGAVQDITERRSLEIQLRQAQKLEAIGRLAGGVAHDFNNLLTAILGNVEHLLYELGPDDGRRPSAEQIREAALRAATLTQQLLAFGRKQMLELRVLDLNAVIADMHAMLRRLIGEHIELVLAPGAERGLVQADPGQLEQVLMNLVLNARDAMPGGGRLTLATGNVDRGEAGAAGDGEGPTGRCVVLTVSDTGVGMSPEIQAHIFEPFYTTKEVGQGTGLGLSTVYGIVAQTGGTIEVESAPGRGSTFRIVLPCVAEGERPASAAAAGSAPRGEETVLLVEDEAAVRSLMADVLQRSGYRVLAASGGDQALALAAAEAGRLDLLVSDVVMPGMGGRELARRLVLERPDLKVLYVSGYADEAQGRRDGRIERGAFLQKPFTPVGLARRVREVLDGPAPAPGR